MDPNAEDRPPRGEVVDVEVDFSSGSTEDAQPPAPAGGHEAGQQPSFERITQPTIPPPQSASSIFRDAMRQPSDPSPSSRSEADLERERQMNEEAFQRKLRGEYEAAQQRLGQIVSDNMTRPLTLKSIRISPPPPHTRPSFLSSTLSPFLSPGPSPYLPSWLHPAPTPPPQTLQEVLVTTRALVAHLRRFGVFDDEIGVRLESEGEEGVGVVLGVKERGRVFVKAGTEVGGGEGGGNLTARIRNVFGGAETLEAQASLGTKTKSAYQATLSTPVLGSPLLSFALGAFSFERDNSAFASHREFANGARATLSALAPWGTHELMYEYIQRDIGKLSKNASVSIRELANPSTKSSISHTFTSDTRDDPWWGTAGRLLRMTYEYAGLPGSSESVKFVKSTTHSQIGRRLYPGSNIHFSLTSLTTFLYPLSPSRLPTQLPDRTYLGGPNSLRGWKVGGSGLRDGPDSLGGDMSWGAGVSVFAPLWMGKERWPVRWHVFGNAGKVLGYRQEESLASNVSRMYAKPNVSVGLGVMYRLDPLRVEVNFSMPLVARKGERLSRGFGVGVGIEFL